MQFIKVDIFKRNRKINNPTVDTIIDIDEVVSPIRANAMGAAYFSTFADEGRKRQVNYETTNSLASVAAQTYNLVSLSVVERNGVTMNETMLFNVKRVFGYMVPSGSNTAFRYMEGEDTLSLIEYKVSDSLTSIMNQLILAGVTQTYVDNGDAATLVAAKAYADTLALGLLDLRGAYDASGNTFPASGGSGTAGAVLKGDLWYISVAGTLGGVAVNIGDAVFATVDTPGQTAGNWEILQGKKVPESISFACSDEATALTTGTAKITLHAPFDFTLKSLFAGLTTAQASGSIFTVDVNKNGATILSTKITIDNTETSSLTAATPPVISTTSFSKGDIITVDIDQVGNGTATGLKVYMEVIRTS